MPQPPEIGPDFSNADPDTLNEDDVREDVISPMIRSLGYSLSGDKTVRRSKKLAHPFVYIGSRRHRISVVPDYTLFLNNRPVLIIEAKRPSVSVDQGPALQQAYSYAIHPDIRCPNYSVCNGLEFIMYQTSGRTPVIHSTIEEIVADWPRFFHEMSPSKLSHPFLRELNPDFGNHVALLGYTSHIEFTFEDLAIQVLSKLDNDKSWNVQTSYETGGISFAVSIDIDETIAHHILNALPINLREAAVRDLNRTIQMTMLNHAVAVSMTCSIGTPVTSAHEVYTPLIAKRLIQCKFSSEDLHHFNSQHSEEFSDHEMQRAFAFALYNFNRRN